MSSTGAANRELSSRARSGPSTVNSAGTCSKKLGSTDVVPGRGATQGELVPGGSTTVSYGGAASQIAPSADTWITPHGAETVIGTDDGDRAAEGAGGGVAGDVVPHAVTADVNRANETHHAPRIKS